MAENIDATTDGSGPYNTSIPELVEDANIQKALRIYHYGSSIPPEDMDDVLSSSIAGHFKTMSTRVTNLETQGIGSSYLTSEPSSIPNGYIWVDADSAAPVFDETVVSVPSVVRYQNSAPSANLKDGMQWVDKDDPFLTTYVYDEASTSWIRSNQIAKYQNDTPTGNIVDGSLWVDKDDAFLTTYVYDQGESSWIRSNQIAKYEDNPPTGNILEGSLWVDKNSSPLAMYVYDSVVGWREIGGEIS
jgi:hypothetical protein